MRTVTESMSLEEAYAAFIAVGDRDSQEVDDAITDAAIVHAKVAEALISYKEHQWEQKKLELDAEIVSLKLKLEQINIISR